MSIGPAEAAKIADTVTSMNWFKTLRLGDVLLISLMASCVYGIFKAVPQYMADDREVKKQMADDCAKRAEGARLEFTKALESQQKVFERALDRFEGKSSPKAATATTAKTAGEG